MMKDYSGKTVVKAGKILANPSMDKNSAEFQSAMDVTSFWRFNHEAVLKWIEGKTIRKVIVVPGRLVNIAVS